MEQSLTKARVMRGAAAAMLVLGSTAALAATARADWVYRTVRVCEPRNSYVQRCQPERKCETSYRFESKWCATCNPPRTETRQVPYQICSTQTNCRREVVTTQSCRNEQRRVWVQNPKVIPKKVMPPPAEEN